MKKRMIKNKTEKFFLKNMAEPQTTYSKNVRKYANIGNDRFALWRNRKSEYFMIMGCPQT